MINWAGNGTPRVFCKSCQTWIDNTDQVLDDDLIFEDSGPVDFNLIEDELGGIEDHGPYRQITKD